MSAMGSAKARGPDMWSDIGGPGHRGRLVGGLVQQRLHRRVLEGFGSLRVVEHPLEGGLYPLRLLDLLHGAAVVACVGGRALLGREDERMQRGDVRKSVVALHVPEDGVEQPQ